MASLAQAEGETSVRDEPAPPRSRPGWRAVVVNPSVLAVAVWVLTAPVAVLLPRFADMNPFSQRSLGLVLASAFAGVAVLLAVGLRRPTEWLAGVATGLFASWIVLAMRMALHGTPFGFGGLLDDAGRINAMATRYTDAIGPADLLVPGLPAQYPPLYLMVTGRLAVLLDQPAWHVLAWLAPIAMAGSVLVGFLLWRRVGLPAWVAFAVSVTPVLAFPDGRKTYETLILALIVPWVLLTFGRPPRGRWHWLPAGALGALMVCVYQAWLVFLALAILALIVVTWRATDDRRGYLRHVLLVMATAAVLSSWYLGPYLWAVLTKGGREVSDTYVYPGIHDGVLPFLNPTVPGVLQLVGLVGLVWFRRRVWWASPLLIMVVGLYAYRVLTMLRYVQSGHTTLFNYTTIVVTALLLIAGVLTIWHATGRLIERFGLVPPAGLAAGALAVLLAWTTFTLGTGWMPVPEPLGPTGHAAAIAHREPLRDGGYPRYATAEGRTPVFPVNDIQRAVEQVYGADMNRITISPDERLYAYLPWPGYMTMTPGGASALSRYFERLGELRRVARITDPAEFARASADTRFGPIDVFVMKKESPDVWAIRATTFTPAQFSGGAWIVTDGLASDYVVAVRRP